VTYDRSPRTAVSSTNKTDRHDIAEILLKMVFSTIKPTNQLITDKDTIYVLFKISVKTVLLHIR
jgi:hypothetical protein